MRSKRLLPALATGALLLAACGTSSDGSSAPATEPVAEAGATPDTASATPASAPAESVTDAAPADVDTVAAPAALQFTAPLVGGGEIDASSLAGKPTVFWFWAPT